MLAKLLAAVEAVLTLHAPREQAVLSDPDCLREECDHDGGCPLTGSVTVCAACWDVAEDAYPYFCEEGIPDEVLHPCPTVRAMMRPSTRADTSPWRWRKSCSAPKPETGVKATAPGAITRAASSAVPISRGVATE